MLPFKPAMGHGCGPGPCGRTMPMAMPSSCSTEPGGQYAQGCSALQGMLLRRGYAILLPDARARGDSGGPVATYGYLESGDIARWLAWLRQDQKPRCVYRHRRFHGRRRAAQFPFRRSWILCRRGRVGFFARVFSVRSLPAARSSFSIPGHGWDARCFGRPLNLRFCMPACVTRSRFRERLSAQRRRAHPCSCHAHPRQGR